MLLIIVFPRSQYPLPYVHSLTPRQRETLPTDGRLYQQADLRNSLFNEVNADLTSRCENSFDLAALVALHAVTVLCERCSHPDLEIFRIFEEAISILVITRVLFYRINMLTLAKDRENDNLIQALQGTRIQRQSNRLRRRSENNLYPSEA